MTPLTKRSLAIAALLLVGALAWAITAVLRPAPSVTARAEAAQEMLAQARTIRTVPVHFDLATLPLPTVTDSKDRKALFIAAMLPLVVRENTRIDAQRARAKSAPVGSAAYAGLAHVYGLHPKIARAALLERIDSVPASLTLAQGAIESGWGTSRFAQQGNAYFGERTYNTDTLGLVPKGAQDAATPFKVKSFFHAHLSVRSFMKTINTNPAYRDLRRQRAALRAAGRQPTGLTLAPYLHGYSEIGDAYIQRVSAIIRADHLAAYDGLKLVP